MGTVATLSSRTEIAPIAFADVCVFAGQERYDLMRPESLEQAPEMHRVKISSGSRSVGFSYSGPEPDWARPVFESLASRWGWSHGWDGYRAAPTSPELAAKLLNCLSAVMPVHAVSPIVVPLSDGGLQAEWHRGETSLEIVVPADEPPRYYFYDAEAGRDEQGLVEPSCARIGSLVLRFNHA